jgi:hypothetical protein
MVYNAVFEIYGGRNHQDMGRKTHILPARNDKEALRLAEETARRFGYSGAGDNGIRVIVSSLARDGREIDQSNYRPRESARVEKGKLTVTVSDVDRALFYSSTD